MAAHCVHVRRCKPRGKRRSVCRGLPNSLDPVLGRAGLCAAVGRMLVHQRARRHALPVHRCQRRSGIQQQQGRLPRLQGDQHLCGAGTTSPGTAAATDLVDRGDGLGRDHRAQSCRRWDPADRARQRTGLGHDQCACTRCGKCAACLAGCRAGFGRNHGEAAIGSSHHRHPRQMELSRISRCRGAAANDRGCAGHACLAWCGLSHRAARKVTP